MPERRKKRTKATTILIVVIFLLLFIIIPIITIGLDYWLWLGCPNIIGIFAIENYPGHDLTAEYRHEDYFKKIPELYNSYKTVISDYGEPTQIEELERYEINNLQYIRIKAVYHNFYIVYFKVTDQDISESRISYIVITGDSLRFTRDKIKIGDKKERILHCYRYYSQIKESELKEGYSHGYIDGSMLTGQTWVEFAYDDNDCVKSILIYSPW